MKQIFPSIFGADLMHLADELDFLEKENTQVLHIDLMDGNFVSHIAFGPKQIAIIKQYANMRLDVHMMTTQLQENLDELLAMDIDMISVHYESTSQVSYYTKKIRKSGKKAGVALNPDTPESVLQYLMDDIDYVLIMTAIPGRSDQIFCPNSIEKIRKVKKMIGSRPIVIEVDGNINDCYAQECAQAGARWIVVGNFLFSDDKKEKYDRLKQAIR